MKKKILYTLLALIVFISLFTAYTVINPVSPLETVSLKNTNISITYSRPYKNDRLIFGEETDGALVPHGVYWRTGANKHTFIETDKTLIFGTDTLSSGTYSIYTIPNSQSWDIFLNSEIYYFGINQPPSDSDIARFKVLTSQLFNPVEQFTIEFSGDSISNYIDFSWDKTKVSLPFKVK